MQIPKPENSRFILLLLFTTGLTTMGVEIIWIRLFTPYVGPVVYSFAKILAVYLLATFTGSHVYRYWSRRPRNDSTLILWLSLALFGLLPLLTSDARLTMDVNLRVILGVAPFAGVIGFLTPMLVDRWSAGDPDRAGRAYAINIMGGILGPLLSGFLLLPLFGERRSMLLFAIPWFAFILQAVKPAPRRLSRVAISAGFVLAAFAVFFFSRDYETQFPNAIVLRDSTATVTAYGTGMDKSLLVNGFGMTKLTPVTKMMAHLTLASLAEPPRNVLVICFGMGTTFRSVISWGVPATAVELVPSVPKLFSYYHPDADKILASPLAHVVIDDGRRYLERSSQQYDAIIIDPPPPIEAAGSSLLYSRDFYLVARHHLRPGGILQQWIFGGDQADLSAATRALTEAFPYVNAYGSFYGTAGLHFLASNRPIPERSAQELLDRMPPSAVADMMEWGPEKAPLKQLQDVLSQPISLYKLIFLSPDSPALTDDRPVNEYDQLRTFLRSDNEVRASAQTRQ